MSFCAVCGVFLWNAAARARIPGGSPDKLPGTRPPSRVRESPGPRDRRFSSASNHPDRFPAAPRSTENLLRSEHLPEVPSTARGYRQGKLSASLSPCIRTDTCDQLHARSCQENAVLHTPRLSSLPSGHFGRGLFAIVDLPTLPSPLSRRPAKLVGLPETLANLGT